MQIEKNNASLKNQSIERTLEDASMYNRTRIQAGMLCPKCHSAKLDYNGLLQLVCPQCGVIETGAST